MERLIRIDGGKLSTMVIRSWEKGTLMQEVELHEARGRHRGSLPLKPVFEARATRIVVSHDRCSAILPHLLKQGKYFSFGPLLCGCF